MNVIRIFVADFINDSINYIKECWLSLISIYGFWIAVVIVVCNSITISCMILSITTALSDQLP